ncbi:serine protease inhibitor Kazal-type 1-like [Maniola jurtina]|uniref:serine protease inhibitor Kazal-type 1-like n=1 Tax=Maniola jurtina TaxID=191418 RepID=UPI001E68B79C|nr:serine protease inhibitor Kazal-type 1-like [Maniola jurtina]
MTLWLSVFIYVTLQFYDSTSYPARNLGVSPFMVNKSNEDEEEEAETTTIPEEPKKNNCYCSKIYDPVCGTNNKSYYNLCQLQCETKPGTVTVQHQGKCIPYRY